MRRMEERLEAMERKNHSNNLDDSDEEVEFESFEEEEEDPEEVMKILKKLMKTSGRTRIEVPMYSGNLNVQELMDWINSLSKYFDFEDRDSEVFDTLLYFGPINQLKNKIKNLED